MNWRKLLFHYVIWTLGIAVVLAATVLMLDPYDTNYFALFPSRGVPQFGQRMAAASLGRKVQFDTAILGNSTMQLIDPSKISDQDHHAVSLTIPGTGPREQLAVAAWFINHHPDSARAIIIGLDSRWCEANHALPLTHPFPFWLYRMDMLDYTASMMQYKSLEAAGRKIALLIGKAQPLRADGYNDYDTGHDWDHDAFIERMNEPMEEVEPAVATPPYEFAAAAMLENFLTQLPAQVQVLLVMPPRFRPANKGEAFDQQRACEKAFEDLAVQRPHMQLLDFVARRDLTNRDEDYWDRLHYRARVAREMEKGIKQELAH